MKFFVKYKINKKNNTCYVNNDIKPFHNEFTIFPD